MRIYEKAVCICEEFTEIVLFDKTRLSIVVNIDTKYFKIIKKELNKLGYKLIFTKQFKHNETITCTFKL